MRHIHDGARGLRTELDLSGDTPWTRRLAAIRTDVSDALKAEIESAPGRVRRLLRPRPASEIARHSMLDASEVADTEALIELVGACRKLAISEMTLRAYSEVQHHLDTGPRSARWAAPHRRGRPPVPPIPGRCGGTVLRQSLRAGICLVAGQGRRSRGQRRRETQGSRQGLIRAAPKSTMSAIKGRLRLAGRRDVNPS